jgi:hypothetical protein
MDKPSSQDSLTEEDINVRRIFLKKFVDKVEIGNAKRKLYHSFPLETVIPTGMWLVPPIHLSGVSRARPVDQGLERCHGRIIRSIMDGLFGHDSQCCTGPTVCSPRLDRSTFRATFVHAIKFTLGGGGHLSLI